MSTEQHRNYPDGGFLWRMGVAADTPSRVGAAVIVTAVIFALLDFFADMLGHVMSHDIAIAAVRAAVIGIAAGSLMAIGLVAVRQRRAYLAAEMERIAELNHRVRNSLEVIADAQHFAEDPVRSMVLDSVEKIDRTLSDVLPSVRYK